MASAAVIGLTLLSASPSALAGIPGIDATLTSLIPATSGVRLVTYSVSGGTTYQAAYKVHIANGTNSQINNVFFTAVTGVDDKLTGQPTDLQAPFIVPVPGCTSTLNDTRLDCVFGPLPPGSAPIEFTLLVKSPAISAPTPDGALKVRWTIQSGQGQANPSNLVYDVSEVVTLQVGSPKGGVQSYVVADATLGVDDAGSKTNVTPPIPVTVGVKQDINPNSCAAHFKSCFLSTITIVDQNNALVQFLPPDAPLEIDLFRAASSLKKNARFANAQLFYTNNLGQTFTIPTCDGTSAQLTSGAKRCITPAVTNAVTGQSGVDASGNWLFHIVAGENGVIQW